MTYNPKQETEKLGVDYKSLRMKVGEEGDNLEGQLQGICGDHCLEEIIKDPPCSTAYLEQTEQTLKIMQLKKIWDRIEIEVAAIDVFTALEEKKMLLVRVICLFFKGSNVRSQTCHKMLEFWTIVQWIGGHCPSMWPTCV